MPEKLRNGRTLLSELDYRAHVVFWGLFAVWLMTRVRWRIDTATSEQLGDVSGIEQIALVAELAVDLDGAVVLLNQLLCVLEPQAYQRVGRTLA